MQQHRYSFIIPVYNRPDEVDELLDSITKLEFPDGEKIPFEVIIVEDGSTIPCKDVVERYMNKIDVRYFVKENSGPGYSRNFGTKESNGDYFIFLDSDVIIPNSYLTVVNGFVLKNDIDAFGGPDAAHFHFTNIQKAVNYSMTSFFTTGGIRGQKKKLDKFYPRSFNMGVKKDVFAKMNGFSKIRYGEDVEISMRIYSANYKVALITSAFVFHKRRINMIKFFKQIFWSGRARINLYYLFKNSLKSFHFLPSLFTIFSLFFIISSFICVYAITPLLLYALMILIDSSIKNKSIIIGFMSIITSFIQHWGYGTGFIVEFVWRIILRKEISKQFMKG